MVSSSQPDYAELLTILKPLGENEDYLRLLEAQIKGNGIIPFVGAGLSIPFGMLAWNVFLLEMAEKRGIKDQIQQRLDAQQYEEAAEDLLAEYREQAFHDKIQAAFGSHKLARTSFVDEAVSVLPKLATGPVITTNFDQILEMAFEQVRYPFERIVIGSKTDLIAGALSSGKRFLLKVHGDVEDQSDRILTFSEYEQHYGTSTQSLVDFSKPLPLHLRAMMQNRPLLFVGCSFNPNRLFEILRYIISGFAHYAIVPKPNDRDQFRLRAQQLSSFNIRPIWYPEGRHDLVKALLEYLAGFVNPPLLPEAKLVNVPPQNPFFTGRVEILDTLHNQLKVDNRAVLKQAVFGLGGVGKTQTAVEYAHRHVTEYTYVLWTRADDGPALTSGFINFAEQLGLPPREKPIERVEDVKYWLAANHNWLLIFDNADKPDIVQDFLPMRFNGKVLLTSRAQSFSVLGVAIAVELDVMTHDEALAFLKKRTGYETLNGMEEAAALALSDELGHLPLALEQAAAYIKEHGVLFTEFLPAIRLRLKEAIARFQPVEGNYKESDREKKIRYTVATTWLLNFEQVEKESPASADVLRWSAFLAPDAIPLELLKDGAHHISPTVAEAVQKAFTINELVTPLRRYSLISLDTQQKTYDVHRLVQAVTQDQMDESAQTQWAKSVVLALNKVFPEVKFENWPTCARMLPHARLAAEFIKIHKFVFLEAGWLLIQTGVFLSEQGRYAEAEPFHLEAVETTQQGLSEDHPNVTQSLNTLGLLYYTQGRYTEAESLYIKALGIRQRELPENHLDIAQSLNNLALLYHGQGRYSEAELMYLKVLEITQKVWPAGHPAIALGLNNLAGLYQAQGRFAEAESRFVEALKIRQQVLLDNHPDIAQSLNNLACLYHRLGRYLEAEPLYLKALEIYRKELPSDHPDIALGLSNLAEVYREQGRYADAERLCLEALKIRRQKLPNGHPDIAISINNLALLYCGQGHYTKAEPLLVEALELSQKGLPDNHPDIASSLNNLAMLYQTQGLYTQAEPLLVKALKITRQGLPVDHPQIATSLNNLAMLYHIHGRYVEAESIFVEALEMRRKGLPTGHPDIAASLNNLAELLRAQGRYAEAEPLYMEGVEIYRRELPADHPALALSLNNLALLFFAQGRYEKANPLFAEAVAIWQKSLGNSHPYTLKGMQNYSLLLHKMGRIIEAEKLVAQIRAAQGYP